jgi:hypothetical protein
LYDQLPKRRGPDRLPGARVRKKVRADDSGHERVSRRRSIAGLGAPRQSRPPEQGETSDTAPNMQYKGHDLFGYIDAAHDTLPSNGAQEQTRQRPQLSMLHSNSNGSLPVGAIHPASGSYPPQPHHGKIMPYPDTSSTSPLGSTSSSDELWSPQILLGLNRDMTNTVESPDIPTNSAYRTTRHSVADNFSRMPARGSLSPLSESPVARISRGRRGGWNPTDANVPSSYTTYPAENPSYEYVPSSGAYIQYVTSFSRGL